MGRLLAVVAIVLALSVGLGARAQDSATPEALASPDTLLCATPLADAGGGTPAATVIAPTTAASPGGFDPGTPIGLFPCGTPSGTAIGTPVGTPTT